MPHQVLPSKVFATSKVCHTRVSPSKVCHLGGLAFRRFVTSNVCLNRVLRSKECLIEGLSHRRSVTSHRRFVSFKVCHIVGWLINLIEGLSHQKLSHQVLIIDGLLDTQPSRQASGHPVRPSEQHGSKHPRHTFRHPGRRLER